MEKDIRWIQRFDNFSKAFMLLDEAVSGDIKSYSQLEKEGLVKRFEFTLELAWKTLKDLMEEDGLDINPVSPRSVFREAFSSKYLSNIEIWFEMIVARNQSSHTYDFEIIEEITKKVNDTFLKHLHELKEYFESRLEK